MKRSDYISPSFAAIIIAAFLCFISNFGMDTYAQQPPTVQVQELADLVQQIEKLESLIINLNKTIQILNDFLDEITDIAKGQTSAALTAPKSKPRSPRQIDQTPVLGDKTDALIIQAKVALEEELLETICIDLLQTKKNSDFIKSLKAQLVGWLQTPAAERSFDSPLSQKQFAWVCYILHPLDYPNPKSIRELYPNG